MKTLHRGWYILALATLINFACLGLGRFAFAAVIPFMKEGMGLDYRQAGLIASFIFLGYLVGSTFSGFLVIRYTAKKVILVSLLIIALGMVGNALSFGFWSAFITCFLVGLGSGGANIPSMGLLGQWFTPRRRGMAFGISTSGSGFGMVFSGLTIPWIVAVFAGEGWRISWVLLACGVLATLILSLLFLINSPRDVNLQPIGSVRSEEARIRQTQAATDRKQAYREIVKNRSFWIIGISYFLWGFSYLIFSTFFVDYLMTVGVEKHRAGQLFALSGILSIFSGWIWGSISDRLGRMSALSAVLMLQTLILLSFGVTQHGVLLLVLTIVYALTLFAVPTVMIASVNDFIDSDYTPVALGFITLFFGAGQWISPIVSGSLIDFTGSYFAAFMVSAFACFSGGLGCVYLLKKQ